MARALSIHEVISHALGKRDGISPDHIILIRPTVLDTGEEAFSFMAPKPGAAINPTTGFPDPADFEHSGLKKSNLEDYTQKNFGHSLPSVIAPHRVVTQHGERQLSSPSSSSQVDPVYGNVNQKSGINTNHGWKIHADLVQDQTYDEALASIGRNSDHSIADKQLAEAFDKRLNNLGMETDDFLKDFKLFGTDPRELNTKYVNPNDFVSAMEVFDRNKVSYKMSARTYGEGRHITAYPQNIVDRDTLISDMESTLGHRLVDQNDPAYRARLGPEIGTKNHPLSRGVSGRFTTDYLRTNPDTGKIDFTMSSETDDLVPEDYKISGKISAKEIEKINKVTAEIPEMGELLHGPDGYVSPYRTIEQIADDRVSGVINPSHTTSILDSKDEYGLIHPGSPAPTRDPLPAINKPGSSPTPSPAPAPLANKMYQPKSNALYSSLDSISINHGYKLHFDPINYDEKTINQINDVLGEKFYFKTGQYGPGKDYTLYAQSLENRDEAIKMIEEDPRISNLIKNNSNIIDSEALKEGNIEFSSKTTGRFTTGYSVAAANQTIDNEIIPDFSKRGNGNSVLRESRRNKKINRYSKDNWTNPDESPKSILGDTPRSSSQEISEDISHLKKNFPEVYELMTGKPGYKTPYTRGFLDQVIGSPDLPASYDPVSSAKAPSAVATETYDHAADVSKATATGEPLVEAPPPKPTGTVTSNTPVSQRRLEALEEMAANGTDAEKEIARKKIEELRRSGRIPRTGPGDLGRPTNIRTTPSPKGTDAAAPKAGTVTTGAADATAKVTTDAPKVKATTPPSSGAPPKTTKSLLDDAAEAARNVARGHGNARTLGIVGAATLLGVGYASTRSKKSVQRDSGTYMDESRRKLEY